VTEASGTDAGLRPGRDDLVATLAARVEAALFHGPEAVLAPDALDEAQRLAKLIDPRYTCDVEAVMMLATFHLHRWRALPEGEDAWDADEAVAAAREAARISPHGHELNGTALGHLAAALKSRFEQGGDPADLHEAIAVGRRAVADEYRGHRSRFRFLINLATALRLSFEFIGRLSYLDEAVTLPAKR
jgi:hypothetical protein